MKTCFRLTFVVVFLVGNSLTQLFADTVKLNGTSLDFPFVNPDLTIAYSNNVILGSLGGTVLANRNVDMTGAITGTGALTVIFNPYPRTVTPVLTLSGDSTFTGGLVIQNGLYEPGTETNWLVQASGTSQSLGNGPVTLSQGTALSLDAGSNLAPGNKITLGNPTALILNSDSFDPSTVISTASSQALLEIGSSTYNRALNLADYGDGTLILGAANGPSTYTASTLQPGAGNIYRLGGTLGLYNPASPSELTEGTLVISGHDNVLTGTASVVVTGPVNLMNANNFSGGISGGPIGIGNDSALGTGTVTLGSLTALNGLRTVSNPIIFTTGINRLTGPLTFTGAVNLNGGAPTLFPEGTGSITFTNVISNGTLCLNSGTPCVLMASNSLSAIELYDGGQVAVSSESNLGGPNVPILFAGYYDAPEGCGTLESTANFTLSNPISFPFPNNQYGTFQTDAGTTLTLNSSIFGGNINKTGTGTLFISSNCILSDCDLYIEDGEVVSSGNSLANSFVEVDDGGTFAGTGNVSWLDVAGGTVAPGGGTGIIFASTISGTTYSGPSNLQFEFTQKGSPTYNNFANSGNGVIALPNGIPCGEGPGGSDVSIFLATSTVNVGDVFKGAFYVESTAPVSSTLLGGDKFTYYELSPTGTTTFNGKTYALLDLSRYNVQQGWVNETASLGSAAPIQGQVYQFEVVSPRILILNGPPSSATANSSYTFTYQASGLPAPTFAVTAGSLPPGLTLSAAGVLSGTPTTGGIYSGTVTASDGVIPSASQNFTITVLQAPSVTNGPLNATIALNAQYNFTYQANAYPTPTYALVGNFFPPGLTLSSAGSLSGTPTATGTYTGTIEVSNSAGTSFQVFTITVVNALLAPSITNGPPPSSTDINIPYAFSYQAAGIPAPTFAVTSGSLAPGLTFSSAGKISGTPTKLGSYTATITASNGVAPNAVQVFALSVVKSPQTITFPAIGPLPFSPTPFALSATASSGLPVTFGYVSGPATLSRNMLTLTGVGTVTVRAFQHGNTAYDGAVAVTQSFTVLPASQTINFPTISEQPLNAPPLTLTATASSGLPITYQLISGPATLSGNVLTFTGLGAVRVEASQAGNANYLAASDVYVGFSVVKITQTITFPLIGPVSVGQTVTLAATSSSGLPVTYSIVPMVGYTGMGTILGNQITFTAAGKINITAKQAGNASYVSAHNVRQIFTVQ